MTVSDQIIQVLNYLGDKFGIAIDWTSENVIPYITTLCANLISYEIWTSVAWIAIMLLFSIASIIATKKLYPKFKAGLEKEARTGDVWWHMGSIVSVMALIFLNLVAIIVIGQQVMDIIKCVTFPELYVFEYIQGIINGAG